MSIPRHNIRLYGASNIGVRPRNEDNFICCTPPDGACALAVVADGIGGHHRGDLASFIICHRMLLAFQKNYKSLTSAEAGSAFLQSTIMAINQAIYSRNRGEEEHRPMGSTIVAALFFEKEIVVCHAGDSRLYEWSPRAPLRQLTCDHVPTAKEYSDADLARYANAILRAVGTTASLRLDMQTLPRRAGSRYLLCSDGLYRPVEDMGIAKLIAESDSRRAASLMLRQALVSNGRDNITGILVRSADDSPQS